MPTGPGTVKEAVVDIDIISPTGTLPTERAWNVSMVIKTFKGRKDVLVRLFRPSWMESETRHYDWATLLAPDAPDVVDTPERQESRRRVLLEAFTAAERDALMDYLTRRYQDKVSAIRACPVAFPLSRNACPACEVEEGKDTGCIHLEKLPDWSLPFPVRGAFDLSQHLPIIEGFDQA